MTNELHEALERFNSLPDDAILPSRVTGIILGLSERTVRYHPHLPRVQISRGRYGQRVRDIRDRQRFSKMAAGLRRASDCDISVRRSRVQEGPLCKQAAQATNFSEIQ